MKKIAFISLILLSFFIKAAENDKNEQIQHDMLINKIKQDVMQSKKALKCIEKSLKESIKLNCNKPVAIGGAGAPPLALKSQPRTPETLKEVFIKLEILPHIKDQQDLILALNEKVEVIKTKSKCDISTNLCSISKHDDPIQRMKENDICLSLLDETRKNALKNCPKKEETQP